jgi:hypothetical protein
MTAQISSTITACPPLFVACATIAVPATPSAIDPSAMTVIATLRWAADGRGPGAGTGVGTWYPGGWYPGIWYTGGEMGTWYP